MARLARIVCTTIVVVALIPVSSLADPISILHGSIWIRGGEPNGAVNLIGSRGFSLVGTVAPSAGLTGLFGQCIVPECTPGTRIDFGLHLTGASGLLTGTMTIEGDRYDISENVTAIADVFLHVDGAVLAPAIGPARPPVSAPFSLTGRAFALTPFGEFAHDDLLFGRGVATVTLVPFPANPDFGPSWMVDSARFDFAEPVPEPATLVLVGTGALLAARARRRPRHPRARLL
jgi:hypothetical protein